MIKQAKVSNMLMIDTCTIMVHEFNPSLIMLDFRYPFIYFRYMFNDADVPEYNNTMEKY